jgi:antitoxin component YwqK of YwqJK toxin-antitoxin module
MVKKIFYGLFVLIFLGITSALAEELMMKTVVVSQSPFIVEEQFFLGPEIIASLKVQLTSDEGGQKTPVREIIETNGTIPDGIYKEYYPSGQTQFAKEYKDGMKHGPSLEYYEDGNVKRLVNYVAEMKQGEMKEYYPDGILQTVRNYKNNEQEGITSTYFPDGKLQSELTYERGAATWWKTRTFEYNPEGNVRSEYSYDERAAEGYRKIFHPNGAVWKSFDIKDGKLLNYQEFDDQSQLLSKQDGLFNGAFPTSFYVSGEVMQADKYVNGVPAGFIMYDLQGQLLMEQ